MHYIQHISTCYPSLFFLPVDPGEFPGSIPAWSVAGGADSVGSGAAPFGTARTTRPSVRPMEVKVSCRRRRGQGKKIWKDWMCRGFLGGMLGKMLGNLWKDSFAERLKM